MAIFAGFTLIKSQNPAKKAKKRNEESVYDNLTEYREVEKATITDILKQKDNQIKSLNARIKQFEPEVEENSQQRQVTFEEITTLVKQTYPKYVPMLPFAKKQIMEMTKGMSLDEVIEYVKQFTGNKQPGTADPASITTEGFNPNYA